MVASYLMILALNCRLQVEQVNVQEFAGDPLVLALRSLHFLLKLKDSLFFIMDCSFVGETAPL